MRLEFDWKTFRDVTPPKDSLIVVNKYGGLVVGHYTKGTFLGKWLHISEVKVGQFKGKKTLMLDKIITYPIDHDGDDRWDFFNLNVV